MLPIRNISHLSPMCCNFWEKCLNSHKIGQGCSTPLRLVSYKAFITNTPGQPSECNHYHIYTLTFSLHQFPAHVHLQFARGRPMQWFTHGQSQELIIYMPVHMPITLCIRLIFSVSNFTDNLWTGEATPLVWFGRNWVCVWRWCENLRQLS